MARSTGQQAIGSTKKCGDLKGGSDTWSAKREINRTHLLLKKGKNAGSDWLKNREGQKEERAFSHKLLYRESRVRWRPKGELTRLTQEILLVKRAHQSQPCLGKRGGARAASQPKRGKKVMREKEKVPIKRLLPGMLNNTRLRLRAKNRIGMGRAG